MLPLECLHKGCASCEFHNNCIMEQEMKNIMKRLNTSTQVKYELAVIKQMNDKGLSYTIDDVISELNSDYEDK